MKKLFCLLAACLLALSCAGAEEAGIAAETPDTREADLLDIYRTDGGERIWITAAVQAAASSRMRIAFTSIRAHLRSSAAKPLRRT